MKLSIDFLWQPAADASHLMVVLHGRGDSPAGFEWLQRALGLPLSVVALRAPDPYYDGYSWYDLPPNQGPGIARSSLLLHGVMEELWAQGYLPSRTFLFGFSQGCLMTLEFGGRYERRLRGYIGISGYCHNANTLAAEANRDVMQADWLITHGTDDDVLPVEATRRQMAILQKAGFRLEYREYPKTHTVDEDELQFIRKWLLERMT